MFAKSYNNEKQEKQVKDEGSGEVEILFLNYWQKMQKQHTFFIHPCKWGKKQKRSLKVEYSTNQESTVKKKKSAELDNIENLYRGDA